MPTTLPAYTLDLCIDDINLALGLALAPGRAWFSSKTHEKTAVKHANDYHLVMRHIDECCRAPTYIGRHAKHPDNVELILDVPMSDETVHVLVAVVLRQNARGNYNVDSAYCINDEEIGQRRQRGSVHKVR